MWLVMKPGSILRLDWTPVLAEALDRYVVVLHPRTSDTDVESTRRRLAAVGRLARTRYRWSRAAHALVVATPFVFLAVAVSASKAAGGSTEAALEPAIAVSFVVWCVAVTVAWGCDARSRRSVRQIREIAAPHVVKSARLGRSAALRLAVAHAEGGEARAEVDMLAELLWRAAQADRTRSEHLSSTAFDDAAFAHVLARAEEARDEFLAASAALRAGGPRSPAGDRRGVAQRQGWAPARSRRDLARR